jgi:hypothetical protein
MTPPEMPDGFKSLTAFFVPYSEEIYSSEEEMVDIAWSSLDKDEAAIVKEYLDTLLSGKYSEHDLRELWWKTKSVIIPFNDVEGSCTDFIEFIRSRYAHYPLKFD